MKTLILAALLSVSAIATVAGPASAEDRKSVV